MSPRLPVPVGLLVVILVSTACAGAGPVALAQPPTEVSTPAPAVPSPPGSTTVAAWTASPSTTPAPTAPPSATPRPPRPRPTATPSATVVPVAAHFRTLLPGATLPGDADCASRVRRSPWEPRPQNTAADHRVPAAVQLPGFTPDDGGVDARARGYADRVTGDFTGTTDEIIQWAACKWGFDEDIVRAVAVNESTWDQATVGDVTTDASLCAGGYQSPCPQSFGLLQIKWTAHPGTFPWSRDSIAFNADYALMWRRVCYEGWMTWVSDEHPAVAYFPGDEWGCVGLWFSGNWMDAGAVSYIRDVRHELAARRWLEPGF